MQIEEGFFRHETARIVATLTRLFGLDKLALAEDVAQDAFCRALEVWKLRGTPENPSAWLMAAAKNRAIDVLRRERSARQAMPALGKLLKSEWTLVPTLDEFFSSDALESDQLRMMFSCCDPILPEQTQVALMLNLTCAFTANEIANALLSGRAAIEKRIARGRKVLAASKRLFDLNDNDFSERLFAVQRALYLLFNEGYHGASMRGAVRAELCREAMRLASLLLNHALTATPQTYALCALMWLNAARLPARIDRAGNLTPLFNQDRSRWDASLVREGERFLERAAAGNQLSDYHIEAAIAAVHAKARSAQETDWKAIVSLYDALMAVHPSPVVALNRAIAIAQNEGPDRGLDELRRIGDSERLKNYPFYFAAFGELELRRGRLHEARAHFQRALAFARNAAEHHFYNERIKATESDPAKASNRRRSGKSPQRVRC